MNGRQDLTVVPNYDTDKERKQTKIVGKIIVFLLLVVLILLFLKSCVFTKTDRKDMDFIFDFNTSEVVVPEDGSPAYFHLTVTNYKDGEVDPYGFQYEIVIKPDEHSDGSFRYVNQKKSSDSSTFQKSLKIDGTLGTVRETDEYIIYAKLADGASQLGYTIDYELNQK